ncbi:MAG TPA: methyltransferase domain-containing protein [Pseudobacteroides sp.]|uniref:class I SAM-dependent methyltransferase n=1 Tax=Pseudobacteroides sp. TaxID=1968840 RepID=UPI002F956B62
MDKKTEQSMINYNKIAAEYDNTFDGRFTKGFKEEIANVIHLNNSFKVLDVACGNGNMLKMLSGKNRIQAYGVDISENMIKEAKCRYPEMQFVSSNSSKLPFEDSFFDVITVCAAFHHFTEPQRFASEAKRVLKPGGYIYLADIHMPPIARQLANLVLPHLKMGDVKVYGKNELMAFFQEQGFVNLKVKKFGMFGQVLIGMR